MTPPEMATPRYRIIPGREGDLAAPASGLGQALAKATSAALGRTGLAAGHFRRGYRRMIADPTARFVRLPFADAFFGQRLVVEIDPARLDRYLPDVVTDEVRAVRLAHWFLDGCDWSAAIRPLAGSEVDMEVAALFEHEDDIRGAPAYRTLLARISAGDPDRRNGVALDTRERIDAYFEQYRRLVESIRRHGVTPRDRRPADLAPDFVRSPMRGAGAERREREVGLAIDRAGELIRMVGGRHRTAIAQRLGLRRMPARIRLVHVEWLRTRVSETGLEPEAALVDGIRGLEALHRSEGA